MKARLVTGLTAARLAKAVTERERSMVASTEL